MYGHFKADLSNLVVETLAPVKVKYDDLMKNRDYLDQLFKQGADKASQRAEVTLGKVYDAVGLARRP